MRAIPETDRNFGWGASMPAQRGGGAALERAALSAFGGLAAAARRAIDAAWRWRLIHRNVKELSGLDDQLLADIGLHRSEIIASVHRRVAEIERAGRYSYW